MMPKSVLVISNHYAFFLTQIVEDWVRPILTPWWKPQPERAPGESLFERRYIGYKPSGFQPSKMFGFDFHTYLTDMLVSNGNLQFLWRSLPKDRWKKQFRFWTDRLISVWGELISTKKDPYQAKHPKANLLFHEGIPHPTYLAPSRSSSHVILMS